MAIDRVMGIKFEWVCDQYRRWSMSSPFYYPFFSARTVFPDYLLHKDASARREQVRQELLERQLAVRIKQHELHSQSQLQYQSQLKSKQNAKGQKKELQECYHLGSNYQGEGRQGWGMNSHKEDEKYNQRSFLDHSFQARGILTKEQKEMQENNLKAQQYQQELLLKIQSCRSRPQQDHRDRETYRGTKAGNRKDKNQKGWEGNKNSTLGKKKNHQKERQKAKRSVHNFFRENSRSAINFEDYQTIDVDQLGRNKTKKVSYFSQAKRNHSFHQPHQKQKSMKYRKAKTKDFPLSQKERKSARKDNKVEKRGHQYLTQSGLESVKASAMQRIQNRLRVSEIVFKDSKWASGKHEQSHLSNTFELEEKGRKQVKDCLNNHPQILKKHALVVLSR